MHDTSYTELVRVLLIEDDEDDYFLAKSLFSEIPGRQFKLTWARNYGEGLEMVLREHPDVCLVDYRLGARNGIQLLQEARERGCLAPVILLTGQGEHEIDIQAMKAGASDYLIKGRLEPNVLERSIRYAIERKRAAACAASEQARLAAFGADVGLALTGRDSLDAILKRCATAMGRYLDAALARMWVFDRSENALQLVASVGATYDPDIASPNKGKVLFDQESLRQGKPIFIPSLVGDLRVPDQAWVRREEMASFAACPLLLEERLVGLMGMFARHPLDPSILQEMSSVANGIALCIDRKRSAQALDASEVKYRAAVENIKEVIFQTDKTGQWIFLNPAWTEITGFTVAESLSTPFTQYIHPEDLPRHAELLQEVIERKVSFCRDQARYRAKDGSYRWVEVYAQPTFDTGDAVLGASGTISDITERMRAEAEIKKLAAFPRFNPDPVMELAADGSLTYLNNAAREMAQSLGVESPQSILPLDAASLARQCLQSGQNKTNVELTLNGRTLSWSFLPIMGNQVVHCYGSDITDRINLENQLRHSQKMESVGQLAAGVAHDFNNILTIIQGHSDILLNRTQNEPATSEALQLISDAANRASTLTRQLLTFSRKQVMQTKTIDLNQVLGNMTKMLRRLLGDDVLLESRYESDLPCVDADPGMLEQVIMNLAVNARDAMPKGGQLLIHTSKATINTAYTQHHPDARPGTFTCLTVTDTGCGMDQPTLQRIFEPFFTTKGVGKGTGLGLATVYGIIKQHQGWIEVVSSPGIGSTFKIFFPTSNKKASPVDATIIDPAKLQGSRETILLVEDEPVLRELARMVLQGYNYNVLEASNGVEALSIFEHHTGSVDLLLTDMVMPEGVSGRDLAEKLRAKQPALKIIFTSGYSAEAVGQDLGIPDALFLQKPYPPPKLAQMVRTCLDCNAKAA